MRIGTTRGAANMIGLIPGVSRLLAVSSVLLASMAGAQNEARVVDEVRTCAELQRDAVRLACFDAIARAVGSGVPASTALGATADDTPLAAAGAVAPTPTSTAQPAPPAATFGLPAEPEVEQAPAPQELVSSVAALRELQPGRLEITLANGQIWRQTHSDRYALAVGHEVRIYPTRFGRYFRLTAKALRSFVQVERVR